MAGAFQTGTYRNVFAEAGYSEEIIKKRLEEIFQTMFYGTDEERIYYPVGDAADLDAFMEMYGVETLSKEYL